MTCQTCDTAFEYEESDMIAVPGFSCMKAITCPNCHQTIIMVPKDYEPIKQRIIVEEENEETIESN